MPCRIELLVFLHPQISVSPPTLNSFMFVFDAKSHHRSSVSLNLFSACIAYGMSLELEAVLVRDEIILMQWQLGTGHSSGRWGWRQLPDLPASGAAAAMSPPTSTDDIPAVLPQPEQGRTPFCLILSLVAFPCCLKFQGEQRCKVTAVFMLMLYFGSRRAFLLLLLLPPAPASIGTWWVSGHCSAQGQAAVPRPLCGAGSRQEALNSHGLSIHAAE